MPELMPERSAAVILPSGPLPAAAAARRSAPVWNCGRAMIIRSLRLSLRNVDGLLTALALPVMLMLMFVYLFGGAVRTGGRYVDYVVPGVLLVCVGFSAGTTAVSVSRDLAAGIIDRFRAMDVSGAALINGHVVASVARNAVSTMLVFAVAFAIGFRSSASAAGWLGAIAILAAFVLALSWLAAAIGIMARSAEAANGITFLIAFLAYPSSAFVPVATMPGWLQGFARHQPVTLVIDTIRSLLRGGPAGPDAWPAVTCSLAIMAGSAGLAAVLYQRRAR